ncbi:hypothetical protein J6590_045715 [Homalodisca vitripennis]|nr:hypothetical protein J6590_045715 [Homalodisca vitripennis]
MASTSRQNKELMFSEFCAVCDKISTARREKKADILKRFISDYHANNWRTPSTSKVTTTYCIAAVPTPTLCTSPPTVMEVEADIFTTDCLVMENYRRRYKRPPCDR